MGTLVYGPQILTRTLGTATREDKFGNRWQYHSRSDHHSKIACWGIVFDLLLECALLRSRVEAGRVAFGINHRMQDFRTGRAKDLDLVICTEGAPIDPSSGATLRSLADRWKLDLSEEERRLLRGLPEFSEARVGTVQIALEAKACMTAHVRALPRLHDELNSSHLAIHGSSDYAIACGFVMVNRSKEFVSPDRNKWSLADHPPAVSQHKQPMDAIRVIEKVREIPRRSGPGSVGFDAIGLVVVEMTNDGGPVSQSGEEPAPGQDDLLHYDAMIRRIAHSYETRFAYADER